MKVLAPARRAPRVGVDTSGMGLSDSGPLTPDSSYAFSGAGTYRYQHPIQRLNGSVGVGVVVRPGVRVISTQFQITWAVATPPAGFVYDVQVSRPNQSYSPWQAGVSSLQAQFTPDAGVGRYFFQARLRNSSTGAASAWSRSARIRMR